MYIYIMVVKDSKISLHGTQVEELHPWVIRAKGHTTGVHLSSQAECSCQGPDEDAVRCAGRSRVGPIWSDNDDEEGAGGVGG